MSKSKILSKKPVLFAIASALVMIVLLFVMCNVVATAASVGSGNGTWISGKLNYTWEANSNGTSSNGAKGSVSVSGNTLTVTATNSKFVDGGCSSDTAAEATTTTVTATNASSYPLKITTLTAGGNANVSGVSQGDTIASGATFTVTVTAPAVTNSTTVSGTVNIAVEEQTSVNITLVSSPYVSYTVNGLTVAQNGSDQIFSTDAGTTFSLPSITAPSGYEFKGWRVGSTITTASSFTADAGYTVFPVIVTEGTDTSAQNFKVGSNTYTFWEDAVTAAISGGGKIIVNLADVTLPNNVIDNLLPPSGGTYVKSVPGGGVEYIIPAGVTLQLPYNTTATLHTTKPEYSYKQRVTPTPFRTMTVPNGAKLTVNGSVSVDSFVCAYGQSNQGNGTPSGPHGKIVMKSGSEMTLNNGANLYCYGYINGDGNISVKSGAKVYELFQFCDWRGGNGTNNIEGNSQRVFPMSQYYVQNVEAPMTIYKGATEYVWSVVNMSSSAYPTNQIEFIGENGMFKLTGGSNDYIMKRYHANVDRLEITAHGDMSLNNLTVSIGGLPLIGTISMNSKDYVLPLNNMNIVIETGTTSIASSQTYGVAFLPSSKLTVNEGATFSVNAPVYFYDSEDWGGYCGAGNAKLVVSGYSTANGTATIRTADNLKDAELDVNGTVNVSNKLYTTAHGANITSSEGTGVINFTTACATGTATTYQATQSGTDISYVSLTCNNAWLHNGDDSYSYTVSTGTSKWYYHKSGEHWYRYLIDFKYNNNTISYGYYCENNDTVTYDASWLSGLGATASNGTAAVSGTDVNITGVTADSVVTLTGTPAEYIPTFVLSEEEYSKHYQLYMEGSTLPSTTINDETYYIVHQGSEALAVGTGYAAPTDASMGVTAENHNTITWNMSGISATSGNPYLGTVPAGETAQGPTYIYGFYTGVVAYNSWNDQYYDTLIDAFAVLPQDAAATITMLADCGTFEEESSTVAYTAYVANNITLDLNGHKAAGRIVNNGNFTLELNGGTFDYHTGATAAAATYKGMAAVINNGTLTVQDSAGGGMIIADATSSSSGSDGTAVIRNNQNAILTVTGKGSDDLLMIKENQKEVAYNSSYGYYAYNYGIYNLGTITALTNVDITAAQSRTTGVNVYNYNTGVINLISGGHMYAYSGTSLFNYGGTVTTIDGLRIDGKNGITNRNIRGGAIASGYTVANADIGTIGTIENCYFEVGQYAINNNAKITTMRNSTFIAQPDSAQVDTRGNGLSTASEGNVHGYSVVNSNQWWYDSAVWKRTDTSVKNGDTTMLQRRVDEYKTDDAYLPTIDSITDCTIKSLNTSNSNSYGYFALQNYGVINTINGNTTITSLKHPDNAKSVYGYYAIRNESGGKINTIASSVNISAYNYALVNIGSRYSKTDVTYSTTYLASGKLKSGGLATDYDYTFANVSTIGSTAATISSTSQYAVLNYSKIGSITGTVSANYNVIVNSGAASTTTSIETTTANSRIIEHRYFEGNDSSTTANEYRRYFEYTRNTTDGCYIGEIDATVTATGAGYQAVTNQGYIGTLAGTVSTPTGKATSSSTYYPLIYNGNTRQATLKQTEDYYVETNEYGATKYLREYTYDIPTIDTISCTATNPQDYTIQNYGQINNLTGSISGKTITVANETGGPFLTRKTITYYSSATRLAATKGSSEVNCEYTRQPAGIENITGATISTTGTTLALRNYGYVGEIKDSTITSASTYTIQNGAATTNSTVTSYTSNRDTVLIGCTPSDSACALRYDMEQTINEEVVREPALINKIGAGNYISGTYFALYNMGRINEIDSGSGKTTIIYGSSRQALYNLQGCYSHVINTDAVLTNATGTTTNNYTYEYAPAYIGTIKNVLILGKRQAILNGDGDATYCGETPVTIGEIGEGAEVRTTATATYSACQNYASYAKIEKITGGVFMTGSGSGIYGLKNDSTTYPIEITGGDFRGGDGTRALALNAPDNTSKYTYAEGTKLSSGTETATYHTLSDKVLTAKTNSYYFINDVYTVAFDMQEHGTAPADQKIESGKKATQPESPAASSIVTEDGVKYRFDGWYTDTTFKTTFDFNAAITENKTVYAKWTPIYAITWVDGNGKTLTTDEVESGTIPSYDGEEPTKTADAQYTYAFTGWSDGTATYNKGTALPQVTKAVTYTAQFSSTVNKYTVTWKNGDTAIETDTNVPYGTIPSYDGEEPTKTADAQYTYSFAGWSTDGEHVINPLTGITGNTTYIAVFSGTLRSYEVTFVDESSHTTEEDTVDYGDKPTVPEEPSRAKTAQYTYSFNGWKSSVDDQVYTADTIPEVEGEVTYTADYTATVNQYTYTFINEGEEIAGDTVDYGTQPECEVTPTKENTVQYSYSFTGWDYEYYCIDDVDVPEGVTKEYVEDDNPASSGSAPMNTAAGRRGDYAASGANLDLAHSGLWKISGHAATVENLPMVQGDMTITATYNRTLNEYTITWVDGNGNTLKTEDVAYGETPSYSGAEPTKTADAEFTYSFNGNWLPAIQSVTGEETYTAQFNSTTNSYTITWLDEDGTLIDTTTELYGRVPNHDNPAKASDGEYTYDFAGWSPSVSEVDGEQTYRATFTKELIFAGHLLTLDGDIGTNFFINLNKQFDVSKSVVEFSWNDQVETVNLSDVTPEYQKYADGSYVCDASGKPIPFYRTTVNVAPKEMNDQITAVLKVDGAIVATENYTAATYPTRVINEYPDGDLKDLCKALLNYASKAQEQFEYGLDDRRIVVDGYEAPEVITSELVDYHTGNENFTAFGLSGYVGSTLQLNYMTTYSLFFRISNKSLAQSLLSEEGSPCPVTATIGSGDNETDMAVSSYFVDDTLGNKDVFLRVDIENIAASDIAEDITVTFNGSQTFKVNTGAYINSALINGDDTLRATVTALCDYSKKAKIYFDNHK